MNSHLFQYVFTIFLLFLKKTFEVLEKYGDCLVAVLLFWFFGELLVFAASKPFWHDEIFTLNIAQTGGPLAIYRALLSNIGDNNPPLFFVITHYFLKVFGPSEIGLRLPSILSSIGTIWIFHLIVRRYVTVWVTVFTLVLFAFSHLHYFAAEVRTYAWMILLGMLSLYAWLKYDETHKIWFSVYLGFSFLAEIYSHFYGVLIPVAIVACEIVRSFQLGKMRWSFWLATCLVLLFSLSLIPLALVSMKYRSSFHFAPTIDNLKIGFSDWIFYNNFQLLMTFSGIGLLGILTFSNVHLFAEKKSVNRDAMKILGLPLFFYTLTPFLCYALAQGFTNAFYPNYTIISIFAFIASCGVLFGYLSYPIQRFIGLIGLGLFAMQSVAISKNAIMTPADPVETSLEILHAHDALYFTSSRAFVKTWHYLPENYKNRIFYIYDFYGDRSDAQLKGLPVIRFSERFGLNTTQMGTIDLSKSCILDVNGSCPPYSFLEKANLTVRKGKDGYWKIDTLEE